MKAKEYYGNFIGNIYNDPIWVMRLLAAFNEETLKLTIDRQAVTEKAVIGVLKSQNQKWNALVDMFKEKNEGQSPILADGYKRYWMMQMPQYDDLW